MSQRFRIRDVLFASMKAEYEKCSGKIRARGRHSFRSGLMAEIWKFIGVWEHCGVIPVFSGPLAVRQECLQGLLNIMDEPASLREETKFRLLADFAGFLGQEALAKQEASLGAMLAAKDARKASGDTRIPMIPGGGVVKTAPTPAPATPDPMVISTVEIPGIEGEMVMPVAPDPTVTVTVEVKAFEGGQGAGQQARI